MAKALGGDLALGQPAPRSPLGCMRRPISHGAKQMQQDLQRAPSDGVWIAMKAMKKKTAAPTYVDWILDALRLDKKQYRAAVFVFVLAFCGFNFKL